MEDKQLCRQRGCHTRSQQLGLQESPHIISAQVLILMGHIVAQGLINQKWRPDSFPGLIAAPQQILSYNELCRLGTQQQICSRQEECLTSGIFNELGPKSVRPIRLWENYLEALQKLFIIFTFACFWIHSNGCVSVTDFTKSIFVSPTPCKAAPQPTFLIFPCKFFNFRWCTQDSAVWNEPVSSTAHLFEWK